MALVSVTEVVKMLQSMIADMSARITSESVVSALNMAARAVVTHRPEARVKSQFMVVKGGQLEHDLPEGSHRLIDVNFSLRRLGAKSEPARANVSLASKNLFDSRLPNWPDPVDVDRVTHFFYNPDVPGKVIFYPVPKADIQVSVSLAMLPAPLPLNANVYGNSNTDIELSNEYTNAVFHYAMYHLMSADDEDAQNEQTANHHLQMFAQVLNVKLNAVQRIDKES